MNVQQMMNQAQKMQKKMQEIQQKIAEQHFDASSGGNMVTATINGKGDLLKIKIDPSLLTPTDVEMLEDLIVAAFNQAKKNADNESSNAMSGALSGMGLPAGFKMPF